MVVVRKSIYISSFTLLLLLNGCGQEEAPEDTKEEPADVVEQEEEDLDGETEEEGDFAQADVESDFHELTEELLAREDVADVDIIEEESSVSVMIYTEETMAQAEAEELGEEAADEVEGQYSAIEELAVQVLQNEEAIVDIDR
ncbi:hypothetical protein [Salsuginibacillus kocurii]|uniref:hypothetical protein n=1 Tax=Salsuginibacillus kocurii TaxID=427078 RepID=UPI000364FE95|nr:hypothetical protein [Salsuginibacillus kocurii]